MGWKKAVGVCLLVMASSAEETNQFKTLEKGNFSGIQQPLQVVVTNKTQWEELWAKHTAQKIPKQLPPEIDFTKASVIVVAAGRKNTGGYSIEIADLRRADGKTEVIVSEKQPKPGGFNIQALTAPFHIIQVPRVEGKVNFRSAENKKGG